MVNLSGAQNKDLTTGTPSSTTVTLNSRAGDTIIIHVSIGNTSYSVSSVTDTAGNTYSKLTSATLNSLNAEVWIARNVVASQSNVITITLSGSLNYWAVSAASFVGISALYGNPGTGSSNGTTVNLSANVPFAGAAIIACISSWPPVITSSLPSGFLDTDGSNSSRSHLIFGLGGTSGTESFIATISQAPTTDWLGILLVLFPTVPDSSIGSGKPYVTVSPVGQSTNPSYAFNNGADFGPDTPGTKTSGIQEALGTVSNPTSPGLSGTVMLLPGPYSFPGTISVPPYVTFISPKGAILVHTYNGSDYQPLMKLDYQDPTYGGVYSPKNRFVGTLYLQMGSHTLAALWLNQVNDNSFDEVIIDVSNAPNNIPTPSGDLPPTAPINSASTGIVVVQGFWNHFRDVALVAPGSSVGNPSKAVGIYLTGDSGGMANANLFDRVVSVDPVSVAILIDLGYSNEFVFCDIEQAVTAIQLGPVKSGGPAGSEVLANAFHHLYFERNGPNIPASPPPSSSYSSGLDISIQANTNDVVDGNELWLFTRITYNPTIVENGYENRIHASPTKNTNENYSSPLPLVLGGTLDLTTNSSGAFNYPTRPYWFKIATNTPLSAGRNTFHVKMPLLSGQSTPSFWGLPGRLVKVGSIDDGLNTFVFRLTAVAASSGGAGYLYITCTVASAVTTSGDIIFSVEVE